MKCFVDSAKVEDVKEALRLGFLDGVTTNPSLVAREGRDFKEMIQEIAAIADVPVSAEVVATEAEAMIAEAREVASWAANVVVKLPCTPDGLQATRALASEGIKTNLTLIFNANQALLAARAGATYVSLFVGRLDDAGHDGIAAVAQTVEIFDIHGIEAEVIAASIRHPLHMTQAALAGAHIATAPIKVYRQMLRHPLTDVGLERFLEDWREALSRPLSPDR